MKPVNIFWYLYGVVAMALVLTLASLFFTIDYIEYQNDQEDFAYDLLEVLDFAKQPCQSTQLDSPCVQQYLMESGFEVSPDFYTVNAERLELWSTDSKTLQVYSYEHGFQAQLADQPSWWIRDDEEHLTEAFEDNDPLDMLYTAAVITSMLLVGIALFLYWPVRRLKHWLTQLQHATDALAQEDYSVRLSPLNITPLSELAQRFNRMAALIENNLEEKQLLSNAMAHELRTPLSRARLALALLQKQLPDDNTKALVNDLSRYIDELENVTDNSLQLVKLQNTAPQLTAIELHHWLEQKLALRQGQTSHIQWHSELPPITIKSDERLLTLIIDNLLNNAEQYATSQVSVRIHQEHQQTILEIQDDGPGIPEEQQPQALLPFSRLDHSRDRRSGGIGLGLALVNTACQRLNIQLEMNNCKTGLCVVLTFREV
ncbi:ATP-binding protein [Litoribrevibacter euphylliae]|uniref:histidine kinase n=1 Tax=Litoribrevibacter euphylliae TaxID=1834034 RepID=A0ABV7HDF5_9GAMM